LAGEKWEIDKKGDVGHQTWTTDGLNVISDHHIGSNMYFYNIDIVYPYTYHIGNTLKRLEYYIYRLSLITL